MDRYVIDPDDPDGEPFPIDYWERFMWAIKDHIHVRFYSLGAHEGGPPLMSDYRYMVQVYCDNVETEMQFEDWMKDNIDHGDFYYSTDAYLLTERGAMLMKLGRNDLIEYE